MKILIIGCGKLGALILMVLQLWEMVMTKTL